MSEDPNTPKPNLLEVRVSGRSLSSWREFRPKLISAINSVLDSVIDHHNETTIRDEAKEFTSALINHAKAKLNKAGLENEKIEAEVRKIVTQIETERAEARKKHAEADSLEFQTAVKKLQFSLMGTKAMLIGDASDEAILFGKQIESFLTSIKEFSGD
jgi:hypothetical protein